MEIREKFDNLYEDLFFKLADKVKRYFFLTFLIGMNIEIENEKIAKNITNSNHFSILLDIIFRRLEIAERSLRTA